MSTESMALIQQMITVTAKTEHDPMNASHKIFKILCKWSVRS